MKTLISMIIMVFLLNFDLVLSSELTFSNNQPKAGDTIEVEFKGNKRFSEEKEIDLLYYTFNEKEILPTGYEATLKKAANSWTGNFIIPADAVYIMFKAFSTAEYIDKSDNNNGKYWELIIFNSEGVHSRGANLKAALSRLGSIASNIDRHPDFHEAVKFLEKELELYPDNITAELGLITTLFDTKKINLNNFQKRLDEIANKKINENDEAAVRTKVRALYAINEQDQGRRIEARFAKNNPNSEMAEDVLISEISNAETLAKFTTSCIQFFEQFPNSANRERIFIAYISGYMQSGNIQNLLNSLDSINNVQGYVYARIARNIFEYYKSKDLFKDKQNQDLLIELIEKAESLTDAQTKSDLSDKPKLYTKGEWFDILDVQLGTIKEIKAEIYREIEPANSRDLFANALTLLRNNATEALYENYIDLLTALGDSAKALEIAETALIRGKLSEKISEFHRDACQSLLYMNDSLYNLRADSIIAKGKIIKMDIYLNEILDQDEFQYVLETLDGTLVDFRDLKNKITVFNFFSSWCDPCIAMFPAFEELYALYLNNDNVEIVSVNTLERDNFSGENLKRFVVQNDISFPVVRDVMDIIPRQMGVNGLPTIAIFDKKSRVRFLVRGFSNNEKLLDEIAGRIEFLMDYEGN